MIRTVAYWGVYWDPLFWETTKLGLGFMKAGLQGTLNPKPFQAQRAPGLGCCKHSATQVQLTIGEFLTKGVPNGPQEIYRDYMGIMGVLIRDCIGIILRNTYSCRPKETLKS